MLTNGACAMKPIVLEHEFELLSSLECIYIGGSREKEPVNYEVQGKRKRKEEECG